MKLNFCTLFDSGYLSRGLALYSSLEKQCADFHLYVFAFDDKCQAYLEKHGSTHMTVIGLREFEDEELLRIKPTRSAGEYCWTCTPSTILYCIEKFGLEHCTYIDADMEFYHDPSVLIAEANGKDILITDHWYTAQYDRSETSGRFCVQFVFFRNTENGLAALRWWRDACIDWCFARVEEGRFGDQKYLDDWETRFRGVQVLQNRSGALAPWNLQQYELQIRDGSLWVKHGSGDFGPLVFFHFHGLKFFANRMVQISTPIYEIPDDWKKNIFFPYTRTLIQLGREIRESGFDGDPNGSAGESPVGDWGWKIVLIYYLASVKESWKNILGGALPSRKRHHPFYAVERFN